MKPMNLSGIQEIVCATCYNKMVAREDALELEVERSEYEQAKHEGEGSAFSAPEES
jgi:hypothetical protein